MSTEDKVSHLVRLLLLSVLYNKMLNELSKSIVCCVCVFCLCLIFLCLFVFVYFAPLLLSTWLFAEHISKLEPNYYYYYYCYY